MRVRVLAFGVSKDWLGGSTTTVELLEGASVVDLLNHLNDRVPAQALRGIAVSVNAEYATASHVLRDGDEVGLLPPVSGGAAQPADASDENPGSQPIVIALTKERIDVEKVMAEAKRGEDGAIVVFDGIVRNNTRGRQTIHLDYEAYEEMALKQMKELAGQAIVKFGVRHVTLVHRLGRLEVSETSVLIVVASAHRAQAFEASRWVIDTLKKTARRCAELIDHVRELMSIRRLEPSMFVPVPLRPAIQEAVDIVRDLSRSLADRGVSIEELHTEIVDAAAEGHTFRVKALLAVPAALANDELKRGLDALASDMLIDLDGSERTGANGTIGA